MAVICSSLIVPPAATPLIGIGTSTSTTRSIIWKRKRRRRIQELGCCCSCSNNQEEINNKERNSTPKLLSLAVSGLTEILRLFSSPQYDGITSSSRRSDAVNRTNNSSSMDQQINEVPVSSIEDVLMSLQLDYNSSYFVTGNFTPTLYSQDCLFEDPTIKFQGTELYSRNLKLLVPFFENPSIILKKIEKGNNSGILFVLATWKLRTHLRLPWRPFISIDGKTVYELDDGFKIIRHTESWDISALQAVGQIFRPTK